MALILAFYVAPGDWRDALVRAATGSRESHVEILVGETRRARNLCLSASLRDGGKVRTKEIAWAAGHWEFVTLPLVDRSLVLRRIAPQLGAPYDFLGALCSATPLPLSRPGRWFCSELAGHALGLPDPFRLTPGALRRILDPTPDTEEVHLAAGP